MPYQVQGALGIAPVRLGQSASATALAAGTAQTITLPTDPQGNAYAAFIANVSTPVWFCWTTGTGNATIGGANCYLLTPSVSFIAIAPPGATAVSVILDTIGVATASVGVAGVY